MNKTFSVPRWQILFFIVTRMLMNVNTRMIYPFLSVFARGIGVSIEQISLALTIRSLVSVFNPLITPISDQRGRKTGMLMGLALFTVGVSLVVFHPVFLSLVIAFSLSLLGTFLFISSAQAYIGDRVAYNKRGKVMGIIELSWSFSFIFGMPAVGYLISRSGWMSPFAILMVLGLISILLAVILIPPTPPTVQRSGLGWDVILRVLRYRPALAGLAMVFSFAAGNELVNLIFGVWLENAFGLKIAALGAASVVIGLSEMGGEAVSASFVDRLGKEKAVGIGLIASILSGLAMPFLGWSAASALLGLFFFYLSFEFTMVCSLPMLTQVLPQFRATLVGLSLSFIALGRGTGAAMAPYIYHYGFMANALGAVVFNVLALLALSQVKVQAEDIKELQVDYN